MTRLFRSLIFVPANNARFLQKAKSLCADIICFDLEDSVPLPEKKNARALVKTVLKSRSEYDSSIFVRINAPSSGLIKTDLEQIIQKGVDGIVIPKLNNTGELKIIEKILKNAEKKAKLGPLQIIASIESAQGVLNAYAICCNNRVCAIVFGVFDLLNDLGIKYTKQAPGAVYSRAKIPIDAQAAGVCAIDAIWQDLKDSKGLVNDCKIGKELGYAGKSIIHPDQIKTVHKIFAANKTEIDWAHKVCRVYLESVKKGKGATIIEGKMIDEVHYKQAKALLELANSS